jgi:hypothetical protein
MVEVYAMFCLLMDNARLTTLVSELKLVHQKKTNPLKNKNLKRK